MNVFTQNCWELINQQEHTYHHTQKIIVVLNTVYQHLCVCVCVSIGVCVCVCVYMCVCVSIHVCVSEYTCVCECMCVYTHQFSVENNSIITYFN